MCGIVGFVDPRQRIDAPTQVLQRMTALLTHRGPDAEGFWHDETTGIHLGHRRLSILDLSHKGAQPMLSADSRFVLAYNGEIYNHLSLRRELTAQGHGFRGTSDTETLLAGILEWGLEPCLDRCNGMFAFALWDRQQRRLSLVRDRMGIKPLYIGQWQGMWCFASELTSLRLLPGFPGTLDNEAIRLLLQLNYIPAPWSIYQDVRKVRPGTIVDLKLDGSPRLETRQFWDLGKQARRGRAEQVATDPRTRIDELDDLIRQCVGDRMISDVPVGAFLSGGIDSSCVVAAMQAQASTPVRTFSIGFADPQYDESGFACQVANRLGTEHTTMIVTPEDCLATVPELTTIFDEPFADSSQIPTLLVSRLARHEVTVALSGDGGDESFFGYNRYLWQLAYQRRIAGWPRFVLAGMRGILRTMPMQIGDAIAPLLRTFAPASLSRNPDGDFLRKLSDYLVKDSPERSVRRLSTKWLNPSSVLRSDVADCLPIPGGITPSACADDLAHYMMYADQAEYLPDDLLIKVDRTSMSTSLEVRVPLLDHRLIEHAWRVPWSLKYRQGQTKWLLKEVLRRYLPDELIDRPKMGFQIPIKEWLRGPLRSWADDLLAVDSVTRAGIFDPGQVARMWDEHRSGKRHWHYRLWSILMLNAWLSRSVSAGPQAGNRA